MMSPTDDNKAGAVGQILKRKRQSLKLSLRDVEVATKIRGKYLVKLEAGDYEGLANDIYVQGFVRQYANFLGLNARDLAKQYAGERGDEAAPGPASLKPLARQRMIISGKLMALVFSGLIAAAVLAYLGWQFSGLAAPPKIELTSPTSDQVIVGSLIDVAGHAGDGADVFINDSPILTDANGNFSDKLALQDGLNPVKITAKNKLGKVTTIQRNILAHLPKPEDAKASVPAASFDGIALGVAIKGAATWLVVTVDGAETFRGTMLAGTSQNFKGTKAIKLTTSNAGATSLLITNQKVATKNITPVGRDGEIKRDLEFAKDTMIQ